MEDSRSSSARRSRMEVEIDIMQAISDGAGRPTHIMYRSNLSWSVMQSFIRSMESQGLLVIRAAEGRKSYALTEKGQRVLETYHSVKKQLDIVAPIVTSAVS